eukprot:TRINITY_DN7885_c0_g1_i1.p1 TRINITY_DN7885_c0_g1~~TRINITY_DN7885_c0_g1_i1.p1  ORF type:complete len:750 (-),score=309.01 TRINITY_DN7885_c0_g1_i1:165-2360(-)
MDPKWEFNANQFVDFNKLDEEDNTNADEFFDFDMESGERVDKDDTAFQGEEAPHVESEVESTPSTSTEEPKPRKPSNLVTSWGAGVTKLTANSKSNKPNPSKPLPPNSLTVVPHSGAVKPRAMTPRRAQLKAQVEATIAGARSSPRMTRTPKRLGTNSTEPRARTSSTQSQVSKYQTKPSAAIPKTPEVMKRYRAKLNQGQQYLKNTQGVEAIKTKLAKKSEPALRMPPSRPTLTKPSEFKFGTDSRAKNPAMKTGQADVPNFSRMLRSYGKTGDMGTTGGVTQPVPFNFAPDRKRRHSADTNKYKSQAEQIQSYQKGTPERFRSKPQNAAANRSRHRSASPGAARITIPHTPQLSTRGRSRPVGVLSREEREEQELKEQKAQQFKAKGVGETVPKFKYGDVERKACTVPQPFHLTNNGQPGAPVQPQPEEPAQAFHARPVPKGMMAAPSGVPERKVMPVIEPQSPAFALKGRMADRKPRFEPEPAPEPVVKARPAPHRGVPVALPPPCKKSTVAEPFSFERRDQITMEKKEEKIKQIYEEEKKAREFHAKPIMKEDAVKVPAMQRVAPTKPEPFKLQIEERVEARLSKWQDDVEKELEEQKKAAQFKATDSKVLDKAPFMPKPSDKPLSEISNFVLHSDRRAEEREAFDLKVKQKEVDMEGAKREQDVRRKREDDEEVARLRKAAVHKAQPIRNYKPIEVKPSDKPLTFPSSPNFQSGTNNKVNTTYNSQ